MSDRFDNLKTELVASVMLRVRGYVPDKFELISEDGQKDVLECAELLVECALMEASGEDVSIPRAALNAALGNWELAGRIKAAEHGDEFVHELKEALIEAAGIVLGMLGTSIRAMIV